MQAQAKFVATCPQYEVWPRQISPQVDCDNAAGTSQDTISHLLSPLDLKMKQHCNRIYCLLRPIK